MVGLTSPVPPFTFRTPAISLSTTLSAGYPWTWQPGNRQHTCAATYRWISGTTPWQIVSFAGWQKPLETGGSQLPF